MLPLNQGPAATSQGPAASANSDDDNSEFCGEKSARCQDSGRTVLYPDLSILTNDDHWTVTPETHKYAGAAGSFCFVTTANGEKQDVVNLTTIPSVQRSLCLEEVTDDSSSTRVELPNGVDKQTRDMLERCMATCGKAAGARALTRSRARKGKEASAQEVRGYFTQFARAKHLEWKSWIDNEVFDLVDLRKFKPNNHVTSRLVLTITTVKQGNFLRAKARWVLRGFQDKQMDYLQTDSPVYTGLEFRNELPDGSQHKLGSFPH